MDSKELLCYLSVVCAGNQAEIMEKIRNRDYPSEEEVQKEHPEPRKTHS